MKSRLLWAATMLAASAITPTVPLAQDRSGLPVEGRLPPFTAATGWLNSEPLTAAGLRGKVVLVDFWTYTCINWQRTQPYVRAWAEKYKDRGLVVIGAHTPEFEFEKIVDNIRPALKTFRVGYPVAVDGDYGIWKAFDNHYWPAVYIADAQGNIRFHHFGEGQYERIERVIQQLLREAGQSGVADDLVAVDARGSEVEADWQNLRSPEAYLGVTRAHGFASPGRPLVGKSRNYAVPPTLRLNQWALGGDWTIKDGLVALDKPNGRIAYRFHARDVHLVMGPAARGTPVRFRILVDGRPPGAARGGDVDEQGYGVAREQRLYQLVRQPKPIRERQFEIEFLDPGVEAYAFTFG